MFQSVTFFAILQLSPYMHALFAASKSVLLIIIFISTLISYGQKEQETRFPQGEAQEAKEGREGIEEVFERRHQQ
jgi:hypothetical protein